MYLFFLLVAFSLVIIAATVNIQFIKTERVQVAVKSTNVKEREFPAKRGDLRAKDGSLLATSLTYYEVGLDLTSPSINEDTLTKYIGALSDSLARLIGKRTAKEYYRGITESYKNSDRWYSLSRGLNHPEFQKTEAVSFINQGRLKSGLAYRKYTKRKSHIWSFSFKNNWV